MKKIIMKGKTVDEAVQAALAVLGAAKDDAKVSVLSEGKPGMLGVLGGEDAEVEVTIKTNPLEDAKTLLQEVMDKMGFMAVVEGVEDGEAVELTIKGDDLGRIIGKEGDALKALEVLISSMLARVYGRAIRVGVDAGEYKSRRVGALKRIAEAAANEVVNTGREKELPFLDARDRREIHVFLKENPSITTYSKGEGRDRRLVIAPKA
ncbi:MAG: RNA-binding cell elongation regulator Jag/EloR [Candidatus Margulisiibacteriota bacterium]